MKKVSSILAGLLILTASQAFAADPLGFTVGTELGIYNISNQTDPATNLGVKPTMLLGVSVDWFKSIGNLDVEFFVMKNIALTPAKSSIYAWMAANLYYEIDAFYNLKLSDSFTLTPGISYQSNYYTAGITNGDGVFTAGAVTEAAAIEPSVKANFGAFAVKIGDNIMPAYVASNSIDRPIHEVYIQPSILLGDLSAYVRGDFQFYDFRMAWLKWGVSKGLGSGVSLYSYGSWNFYNTNNTYSAFNFYNQSLGVSFAF